MQSLETHGTVWSGAELTHDGGFTCPNLPPMVCYGRTGDQVRASLTRLVGNLSDEDTVVEDLCYILLITLFFKIVSWALLILKTSWAYPLKPLNKDGAVGREERVERVRGASRKRTVE